jgi:hypothetical protein
VDSKDPPSSQSGHFAPDTSTAERAIRSFANEPKTYLFVGPRIGGRAATITYTLIVNVKLNCSDPQARRANTLAHILDCMIIRVGDLLPWELGQIERSGQDINRTL